MHEGKERLNAQITLCPAIDHASTTYLEKSGVFCCKWNQPLFLEICKKGAANACLKSLNQYSENQNFRTKTAAALCPLSGVMYAVSPLSVQQSLMKLFLSFPTIVLLCLSVKIGRSRIAVKCN